MAEKCSSCDQMKKENASIRKALMDTNRNYVEVVNENLELKRKLEEIEKAVVELKKSSADREDYLRWKI